MIEIPVHDLTGKQTGNLEVDAKSLGGELRPGLLKQAFVRYHANRRHGAAKTRNRSETAYSTRKLSRQKGTGNARRGPAGTNIMRGGGHGFAKRPHSWRQKMPIKMRRLANRNALLAKALDNEIKIVDGLNFDTPSTKQFATLLKNLKIDRSCLIALEDTRTNEARSAANLDRVRLTQISRLNVYDLLNHRYLLTEKGAFEAYLARTTVEEIG
jgi:large subunit ribosomal protein L4